MPTPEPTSGSGPRRLPPEFALQVIAVVRRIPKGRLASYGQVAVLAGFPGRPRQVGMVLKGLPHGTRVPWHRVVNNQGHIPSQGRHWSALEQARRLLAEGIPVTAEGDLDLEAHRWRPRVAS